MAESRQETFARILESEGPALRRLASAYEADAARREDLVQEICLAIWSALPRFRGEASLRTFVFRIAHNQAIKHLSRGAAWRREEMAAVPEPRDRGPDPEAVARFAQRAEHLHEAIRSLPILQREVLSLLLEGLGRRQIAEVLGTSENSVGIRLTRARKALRDRLGGKSP